MSDNDPAPGTPPQLQVDSDWKAQAQAEKAKLAEKEQARKAPPKPAASHAGGTADAGGPGEDRFPEADFAGLMNMMVSQALLAMGAMAHPQTGRPHVDLDLASHMIGLLGVLDDKTRGNRSDEESQQLATTLYELRSTYVQVANASRSPATGGQGAGL